MNKFVLLGPPGAGKSTQADLLAQTDRLVRISVGDIIRWNIQNHTKLAARIRRFTSVGLLVPDDIVEEVVRARLQQHDWNFGFVLDGYPATAAQTDFLLETYDVDGVVLLQVSDDLLTSRIGEPLSCEACGFDFHMIHDEARAETICALCGSTLIVRRDKSADVAGQRLREYKTKTAPVIDLFRQRALLVSIDGSLPTEEIHHRIRAELGLGTEAMRAKLRSGDLSR